MIGPPNDRTYVSTGVANPFVKETYRHYPTDRSLYRCRLLNRLVSKPRFPLRAWDTYVSFPAALGPAVGRSTLPS